eukprot:gene11358-23776_t
MPSSSIFNCKISILVVLFFNTTAYIQEVEEVSHVVDCITTKGPLKIEVYTRWAPLGANRFVELVKDGFYTDIALFRCVKGFLTQFGISENPKLKHWHNSLIKDDPNLNMGIRKHYVSFAGGGPNTRSTQIFIAFEDLDFLGKSPWEVPFGKVVEGEDTLNAFYKGYGDIPPFGKGPDQVQLHIQGNSYIHKNFPQTDFIKSCKLQSQNENSLESSLESETDAEETETDTEEVSAHDEEPKLESSIDKKESSNESSSESNGGKEEGNESESNSKDELSQGKSSSSASTTATTPQNNIIATSIVLLFIALVVLYILTQYQESGELGKSV